LIAAVFGSVAVYAIVRPSGDQAKLLTPSSRLVSASPSPPCGLIR
jgi:hypothetical protein